MEDLNTGRIYLLEIKPSNERCYFLKEFSHKDYIIKLRLDWKDLDSRGEPVLDAEIRKNSSKNWKKNKDWHWTVRKKYDECSHYLYLYYFKFKELEIKLVRRVSVKNILDGKVIIKS